MLNSKSVQWYISREREKGSKERLTVFIYYVSIRPGISIRFINIEFITSVRTVYELMQFSSSDNNIIESSLTGRHI